MMRLPKPLETLRFHQMRLIFMLSAIPFLVHIAESFWWVIYVGVIMSCYYVIYDLYAIHQRMSGAVSSPKLVYQVHNTGEYDRIIETIPKVLGAWVLFLVLAIHVMQNNTLPISLRIVAVLLFNVMSLTVWRWLQEVWPMINAYKRQRQASNAFLLAKGRPFFNSASAGQAAPQYTQSPAASIAIRKKIQQ